MLIKKPLFFTLSSWEGNSAGAITKENTLRRTFIIDALDSNVFYFAFQFKTETDDTWRLEDLMVLNFASSDFTYSSLLTPAMVQIHTLVFAISQVATSNDRIHEVSLEFLSSSNTAKYKIEPQYLGVYSRTEVAIEICGPGYPTGAENYPLFDTDQSGFLWIFDEADLATETVYFEINVPRNFYDFAVAFDNGAEIAWYDETRSYRHNAKLSNETFWRWSKYSEEACGSDTLSGFIPWSVLNAGGGGGLQQLKTWSNGTHTFTDEFFYNFGGVAYLFAHEWVYTSFVSQYGITNRAWEVERTLHWRVPFVIRMQKHVRVQDVFNHTATCQAMDVEFTWSANSTRDRNILFNLLGNQTIRLDDVCKNQCDTCHACDCKYNSTENESLQELRAKVVNLTNELHTLRNHVADYTNTSNALLDILTQYDTQQAEWNTAVQSGGLKCEYVPQQFCDGTRICRVESGGTCEDV